ncbi:MAG: cobalamin biosynthesis protein, partial [Hyphomicrobium sp.]|nr:cobalamin biosynthesis protein [Hyphomicrobium sp.]
MDVEEAMIAIGVGCRRGASKEAIIKLVAEALARVSLVGDAAELFTYEGKKDEVGLMAAAEELRMSLHFLSREALQAMADQVTTRSEAAERALGVLSVAEASALAGCGKGGHLLLPRIA